MRLSSAICSSKHSHRPSSASTPATGPPPRSAAAGDETPLALKFEACVNAIRGEPKNDFERRLCELLEEEDVLEPLEVVEEEEPKPKLAAVSA